MRGHPGYWDLDERYERLSAVDDSLEKLNSIVLWCVFDKLLAKALKRLDESTGGRLPSPSVMMFKILEFQALYYLSTIRPSSSFRAGYRSCGFSGSAFSTKFCMPRRTCCFEQKLGSGRSHRFNRLALSDQRDSLQGLGQAHIKR
jgi:hypothetical protein